MTALEKQIASAQKNLEKYNKNCTMYSQRADKYIAQEVKKGNPVSREDFPLVKGRYGWEVSVSPEVKNRMKWEDMYRICDNIERECENRRNIEETSRRLEELMLQQRQKEEVQKERERQYNQALEKELDRVLEPFHRQQEALVKAGLEKHYSFIKENVAEAQKKYRELDARSWEVLRTYGTGTEYRALKSKMKYYGGIIGDRANRFDTMEAYVNDGLKDWNSYYRASLKHLTEKCSGFDVDKDKLTVTALGLRDKGLELVIRDDKPRVVHARVIVAAEYSDKVSEHFRYIVTERAEMQERTFSQRYADAKRQEENMNEQQQGRKR